MGIFKIALCILLISWVSLKVYLFLVHGGFGVHYLNQLPGNCSVVPGIECGSEDIAIARNGLAFITSGLRLFTKCPGYFGKIYAFDTNHPERKPFDLLIQSQSLTPEGFEPHGLTIHEDSDGVEIYVVNHGSNREAIEVFSYDSSKSALIHEETLTHPLFVCLNNVVAVGRRDLYMTGWLEYCPSHLGLTTIEIVLNRRSGKVIHYKEGKVDIAASDLKIPNGIAMSRDTNQLYVAVGGQRELLVYDRTQSGLVLKQSVAIGLPLDNIYVDMNSGDIYVATLPKGHLVFAGEYNDTSVYPPAQAVRLRQAENGDYDVQQVLYSDGKNFVRAATVCAVHNKLMLVGTLWHKFGICRL